jgi:hypothetical protein
MVYASAIVVNSGGLPLIVVCATVVVIVAIVVFGLRNERRDVDVELWADLKQWAARLRLRLKGKGRRKK